MISMGPDLCSRILHGSDPSVLFGGLDLRWGILHNLYRGSWRGLYRGSLHGLCGLDLCPCIFLGRPGLELLEQGFRDWLAGLGLSLTGRFGRHSNLFARRRICCCRR